MAKLSDQQTADIRAILGIDGSDLDRITSLLNKEDRILSRTEIEAAFSSVLPNHVVDPLLRFTSSIALRSDRSERNLDDVLDSLVTVLSEDNFDTDEVHRFQDLRKKVQLLATEPSFYCSIKASYLEAVTDRHVHAARIIVGARPIFDEARNEVFSMIVHANVTLVTSDAAEQESYLSFKVDKQELESIRAECERALQKIKVLEEALARGRAFRVYLEGGEA